MKDPTQKLILLCLADFAHDDGTSAYPSMDTVSALCGCHLRTVRRWMKELQDDGYISLEKPPGYRRPASYRINMAKLKEGGQSVPHDEREGGHPCQRRGTPMSEKGDTHVTQPVIDPSLDPSLESRGDQEHGSPTVRPRPVQQKPSQVVPDDWAPTSKIHSWAESKGFTRKQVELEAERFKFHEFKTAHFDWDRTFMKWLSHPSFAPKPEFSNGKKRLVIG
jgi:hypothetical protein